MTLARFIIVYQKGGDCKGILPLSIILVTMTPLLEFWTNMNWKCIIRFISPSSFLVYQWNKKEKGDPPPFSMKMVFNIECASCHLVRPNRTLDRTVRLI